MLAITPATSSATTLSERPMLEISYVVPEPGVLGVLVIGAIGVITSRRRM